MHVLCVTIGARLVEDACVLEATELVTELVSVTVNFTVLQKDSN
jgi:hypothetical protein